jgi:hypothetical protein
MQDVPPAQVKGRWEYRQGQWTFIEYVKQDTTKSKYVGRFPTGYGKTEIIAGAYVALRDAGRGNRLLIVVPTSTQEEQYAKEFSKKAKRMGLSIRAVVCADKTPRTLKYHKRNEAEVFVTTVQRMEFSFSEKNPQDNWMKELLSTGQWIGAADEYHHYSDENTWGAAIQRAGIAQWIAVSATPTRKVGNTVFGEPAVAVTYEQAFNENPPAVKDVYVKVRDYKVSIEDGTGTVHEISASRLAEESALEGIDKWESRRQLRYLQKYCSPILFHAVQELNALSLYARPGARPQLLVYAHSCAHAQALCSILKGVAPGLEVDWAGTGLNGRDDTPQVLERFLDEVDEAGRVVRSHTIDALVQVNVAGEGFDSKPVCVIVDLSLTGLGPMKLQQWGRGTRFYHGMPLTVFVPSDSSMAAYAPLMRGVFDREVDSLEPPPPPQPPNPDGDPFVPPPLPDCNVIDALLTGCFDYMPTQEEVVGIAPFISAQLAKREGKAVHLDPTKSAEDFELIKSALIGFHKKTDDQRSEMTRLAELKDRTTKAVGQVAGDFIRATIKGGFEKSALGDTCTRINSYWKSRHGGHDSMTSKEFEAKYRWLCDVQQSIRSGEVPSWMIP